MDEQATIVIFGASRDLTRRKLVPALFSLYVKGRLPSGTRVVGFANDELTDEAFRTHLRSWVEEFSGPLLNTAAWDAFATNVRYLPGDFTRLGDCRHQVALA